MRKASCIILLIAVAIFCVGSKIEVKESKDGSLTSYIAHDLYSKCDKPHRELEQDDIDISIWKKVSKPDGDSTFYLSVNVVADGGLNVRKGDTLKLELNGKDHFIKCTRLFQDKQLFMQGQTVYGRGYKLYMETPMYDVERSLIRKMYECKKIPFEIYGSNRHMTGIIPSKGTKLIRKYCDKYIQDQNSE